MKFDIAFIVEKVLYSLLIMVFIIFFIGLYEDIGLPRYAKYKSKNHQNIQQDCIYFAGIEKIYKNTFKNFIHGHGLFHRRKYVYYYLLHNQRVRMSYFENHHLTREQFRDLSARLVKNANQCQNVEYVDVVYFNGVRMKKKIFVLNNKNLVNNEPSPK